MNSVNTPAKTRICRWAVVVWAVGLLLAPATAEATNTSRRPVATSPCPGTDSTFGVVPLPGWADLCALWIRTTGPRGDSNRRLVFDIEVVGLVNDRPPTAYYDVRWALADGCTQDLMFTQTTNTLDVLSGTWRGWFVSASCGGHPSLRTELSPNDIKLSLRRVSLSVGSPRFQNGVSLTGVVAETGMLPVNVESSGTGTPHLQEGPPFDDTALGQYTIGR